MRKYNARRVLLRAEAIYRTPGRLLPEAPEFDWQPLGVVMLDSEASRRTRGGMSPARMPEMLERGGANARKLRRELSSRMDDLSC